MVAITNQRSPSGFGYGSTQASCVVARCFLVTRLLIDSIGSQHLLLERTTLKNQDRKAIRPF
jgi:hypothetical protein